MSAEDATIGTSLPHQCQVVVLIPDEKIVLCLGLVRHSISEAFFITVLWHQLQKYSPVVLVRATTCFSYFNSDAGLNQIDENLSSHRRFKTGLGFSYCDLYFLMSSLMA